MTALIVCIFLAGACLGHTFRLFYHCATGRDIRLLEDLKEEVKRLRAEADRIEAENKEVDRDE